MFLEYLKNSKSMNELSALRNEKAQKPPPNISLSSTTAKEVYKGNRSVHKICSVLKTD